MTEVRRVEVDPSELAVAASIIQISQVAYLPCRCLSLMEHPTYRHAEHFTVVSLYSRYSYVQVELSNVAETTYALRQCLNMAHVLRRGTLRSFLPSTPRIYYATKQPQAPGAWGSPAICG
jgi:hypothetical protein